jgi:hypothetical protein
MPLQHAGGVVVGLAVPKQQDFEGAIRHGFRLIY